MASLNTDNIKKLKRGEYAGYAAAAACGAVLVYFIIAFTLAQVYDVYALRLATLIISPVLMLAGIAVSAYCNLRYGALMEKVISRYVQAVMLENAKLMHPERDKLTFYISNEASEFSIKVSGYKEKIVFNFSSFGKLGVVRRSQINSAIIGRLSETFFRLYERGAEYKLVNYSVNAQNGSGKLITIIENGEPESKSYKAYLKSK